MAANETSRVQSIDVLRTLALLCVLSIHSLRAAIAQVNGQDLSGLTGNQIAASCAIGLSTLGVPLFLMISGYLLLDRDYTKERTLAFFKRNLLPLIVSYEIFDLALAVVQYIGAGGVTVADYVKSALFIGPAPMGHLWYMQAIVGAYLLVPLLALLLHAVRERGLEPYAYAVLACLFVCYSVLPSVNQIMALQGNAFQVVSALDMFGITEPRFLLYMVFGYMVRQGFGMRTHRLRCMRVWWRRSRYCAFPPHGRICMQTVSSPVWRSRRWYWVGACCSLPWYGRCAVGVFRMPCIGLCAVWPYVRMACMCCITP